MRWKATCVVGDEQRKDTERRGKVVGENDKEVLRVCNSFGTVKLPCENGSYTGYNECLQYEEFRGHSRNKISISPELLKFDSV